MTDTKDLIREIQEHIGLNGIEDTATHLLVQAALALQRQADELAAIGAGGVSGPLLGQPQAMPDLSQLTERGAKAWAGVDAQALRDGTQARPVGGESAAFNQWVDDYALKFEPNWSMATEADCFAAWQARAALAAQAPQFWTPEQIEAARESAKRFDHWVDQAPQPGEVLVPTEEMISAGKKALHGSTERGARAKVERIYQAMLAAAPKAPKQAAPAVASKAVLAAIRNANLQLVRTGDDEFALVTLKRAAPQQVAPADPHGIKAFADYLAECEDCSIVPDVAGAFNAGRNSVNAAKAAPQQAAPAECHHRPPCAECAALAKSRRRRDEPAPQQEVQAVDDLAKELDTAREALQWYMRRCTQLQRVQHRMRDPERTMVCDILANGSLLVPEGQRYTAQPAPQQEVQEPVYPPLPPADKVVTTYYHEPYALWGLKKLMDYAKAYHAANSGHVQNQPENEHIAGDVSKSGQESNTSDAELLDFICDNDRQRMVEQSGGFWRVYQDEAPLEAVHHLWQSMTSRWHPTAREAINAARKEGK